jgi:ribonuclease PH
MNDPTARPGGRLAHEIRPVRIIPDYAPYAEGSALIELGHTRVLCAATVEREVPPWLRGSSPPQGWVTAEYAMLPRATPDRTRRERGATLGGRTQEIQRLIGRSLRAAVDLTLLPDHTILLDCDVLQADGGTRTAAITGAYVALHRALAWMQRAGRLEQWPLRWAVAAVSVGWVAGEGRLDLCYEEDSAAEVDLNVVMTDQGGFVEVQGTAEGEPFAQERLENMLRLAQKGLAGLFQAQREALGAS